MHIEPLVDLDSAKISAFRATAAAPAAAVGAVGAPPRWAGLMAHWRAWLPILMRVVATGLALLGLAGIGLAARGSSELPAPVRAPLAAGFAQMLATGSLAAGAAAVRPTAPLGHVGPGDVGSDDVRPDDVRPGPAAPSQCACERPVPCAASPAAAPRPAGEAAGAVSDVAGAVMADGRVILNRAGALDLQRLPGIGAKRAAAILELRGRVGRFRRTSDLLRVKGIGRRTLERLSPQLVLDAPPRGPGVASAAPGAL